MPLCHQYGVDLISLIAPTSENRIAMIAKEAEGFLYIVSSLGVTGTRSEIKTDLASIVSVVRQNTKIPCAIGFGISTPEQAKKMAGLSDGAIVGSAIIKILQKYGKDAPPYVGVYVQQMKKKLLEKHKLIPFSTSRKITGAIGGKICYTVFTCLFWYYIEETGKTPY